MKWVIIALLSVALAISMIANYFYSVNEVIGGDFYCVCGTHYLIIIEDNAIEVGRVVEDTEEEIPSIEL